MYCGICVEVCPFDALFWSPEYEYSEPSIAELLHDKAKLGEWMETVPEPEPLEIGAEIKAKKKWSRQNVAFWILAVAMALAAIGVVRSKNVVHAALYLVVVLAGAAAQYILLAAEFVAWVQVLIYIGAIVILFLFGIMLTRAPMRERHRSRQRPAALGRRSCRSSSSACSSALLVDAFGSHEIKLERRARRAAAAPATSASRDLPRATSCPFEVVSMLLLAALVGAVVLARRD